MSSTSDKMWYVRKGIKKLGPFSNAEMRGLANSGKLVPEDMIWKDGLDGWVKASKLKGAFPARVESQKLSPPALPEVLKVSPPPIEPEPEISNQRSNISSGFVLLIKIIGFVVFISVGLFFYAGQKNAGQKTSTSDASTKIVDSDTSDPIKTGSEQEEQPLEKLDTPPAELLYVATSDGLVVTYDTSSNEAETIEATEKRFIRKGLGSSAGSLRGLSFDSTGNLYVANGGDIRKYSPSGEFLLAISDPGKPNIAFTTIDTNGNLCGIGLVSLSTKYEFSFNKYTQSGKFVDSRTDYLHDPAEDGRGCHIGGIAIDSSDNFYISDKGHDTIKKFSPSGKFLLTIKHDNTNNNKLSRGSPGGLACDFAGNLYVGSSQEVTKYSPSGKYLKSYFPTIRPFGFVSLAFDSSGNLYAASTREITKFSWTGEPLVTWKTSKEPLGLALSSSQVK